MSDTVLLILGAIVSFAFFGYAALVGTIDRLHGAKKLGKDVTKIKAQLAEFEDARELNRCYFNQYMNEKDQEAA